MGHTTGTKPRPKGLAPIGQPSIFGKKAGGDRLQGNVTAIGSTAFEQARARLAKLVGWDVERVSDGDTIEFLARGETATRKYLIAAGWNL
jgi:hypothetical protein